MKLWQKDKDTSPDVSRFTVGADRDMDACIARYDVLGSLAHARMLQSIGLLEKKELTEIEKELKQILISIDSGNFSIEEGVEDVHSQVEFMLTENLGEAGKKIHSGRSRNDQVLVDIRLFLRAELESVTGNVRRLFDQLLALSERHKKDLLPGYTHFQVAMPSSFGLWFAAFAESLCDDLLTLRAAYQVVNQNPLGSAAGFGSSFPLNRTMTAKLLGFDTLNYNVVYAQMGRGKTERIVAGALANIALTLGKLASDCCLYMSQNFGFISFPDELTTGSSIMPHKKNPDVFELVRARCNQIAALPNQITLMTANLPSGYHRDMQLLKESLFPSFGHLNDCLNMMGLMLSGVNVRQNILSEERYRYLFTVEAVNKLVLEGMPFREAYKKIGAEVEAGTFTYQGELKHTHEGSLGNLCNDKIVAKMENVLTEFNFQDVHAALRKLTD